MPPIDPARGKANVDSNLNAPNAPIFGYLNPYRDIKIRNEMGNRLRELLSRAKGGQDTVSRNLDTLVLLN